MARKLRSAGATGSNPSPPIVNNPDLFGEDLDNLLFVGLGIGAAGAVNDKFVHPIIGNAIPIGNSSDVAGKAIDAVTTAASGVLVGMAVGLISPTRGRQMKQGGVLYGVAKAASAVVPQFSLSAKFPDIIPSFGMFGQPPAAVNGNGRKSLPSPGNTPQQIDVTRLGVGKMGL